MKQPFSTARRRKDTISLAEIDDAVDRIIAGLEGQLLTDGRSKRLIAYHEVGHALVVHWSRTMTLCRKSP